MLVIVTAGPTSPQGAGETKTASSFRRVTGAGHDDRRAAPQSGQRHGKRAAGATPQGAPLTGDATAGRGGGSRGVRGLSATTTHGAPTGTFVGTTGLSTAGTTPVLVIVTAGPTSLQVAVETKTASSFYGSSVAGVTTIRSDGASISGDVTSWATGATPQCSDRRRHRGRGQAVRSITAPAAIARSRCQPRLASVVISIVPGPTSRWFWPSASISRSAATL